MTEEDDHPVVRVMDLTESHYELLKKLETEREVVTGESPKHLQRYFRGLRLSYSQLDSSLSKDAQRWRIQLTRGFLVVVRLKPRFYDKIRVRVEQH
jgi:tRNA-dihydrouridine synthase